MSALALALAALLAAAPARPGSAPQDPAGDPAARADAGPPLPPDATEDGADGESSGAREAAADATGPPLPAAPPETATEPAPSSAPPPASTAGSAAAEAGSVQEAPADAQDAPAGGETPTGAPSAATRAPEPTADARDAGDATASGPDATAGQGASTSAAHAAEPARAAETGDAAAAAPFDCLAPLGPGGLRERFAEIVARHPDRARLDLLPLGPDAFAPALVLGARDGADARPALALAGFDDPETWRAALAVAQQLLEEPAGDGASALLERATLYLVPVLASESAERAGVAAARNFPIGWRPETRVPGAGPYPLAAPAARALAAFLDAHPNLSLLLALDDGPCTGPELAELDPDRYRRELAGAGAAPADATDASAGATDASADAAAAPMDATATAAEPPVAAPVALCPGTAASFAWAARGVFPARLATPPLLDPLERQRARIQARAVVDAAARALPGLALSAPRVTPLRQGEVRVDFRVENPGLLPTLSSIGVERRHAGPVELAVSGARVLACATGPAGASLGVCRVTAGRYPLGTIAGRGSIEVCLVLAGEPGAQVVLACTSPRAGAAERALALP